MGFSRKTKDEAMNACARHCCICHRYRGVKIELHHINPKRLLGKNSFENTIPLCFDCHADAGHYFAQHPKGVKLSPSELKKARDKWYHYVKKNPLVKKIDISKHIQTSYYVLHTFDVLEEIILNDDFSSLNKFRQRTYLAKNEISGFWRDLIIAHKKDYNLRLDQTLMIEYREFDSIKQYLDTYSDAEQIDKSSRDHPYFDAKRNLDWDEILNKISPNAFLNLLYSSGVDIDKCCKSYLKKIEFTCGDVDKEGYTEYIEIAPISFVFIGITNASKEQIKLNYLQVNS